MACHGAVYAGSWVQFCLDTNLINDKLDDVTVQNKPKMNPHRQSAIQCQWGMAKLLYILMLYSLFFDIDARFIVFSVTYNKQKCNNNLVYNLIYSINR